MLSAHKSRISNINIQVIAMTLFCIALITKVAVFDFRTLALDEPFSLMHAQESWSYILQLPFKDDPHPPLYYLLLHIWIKIVGLKSIASLKFFSILIHAITAWSLFKIAYRHMSLMASSATTILFIFADAQFFFALDLRAYPLMTLLSLVSSFLAFELAQNPHNKKLWGFWALACALLFYTHYFGLLLVFVQWVYIAIRGLNWRESVLLCLSFSFLSAPGLVVMTQQFLSNHGDTWMTKPQWKDFSSTLDFYFNGQQFVFLISLLILFTLIYLFLKNKKMLLSPSLFYFTGFLSVYTLMFCLSYWVPIFSLRYTVFLSPLLFLGTIGIIDKLDFPKHLLYSFLILTTIIQITYHNPRRVDLYFRNLENAVAYYQSLKSRDSSIPTLLHPFWFHHGFLFHLDRKGFMNHHTQHDSYLNKAHNVHTFWEPNFKGFITKYDLNDFILILDECNEARAEEIIEDIRAIGYSVDESRYFKQYHSIYRMSRTPVK